MTLLLTTDCFSFFAYKIVRKLQLIEVAINTAPQHQLIMCSCLHDSPAIEYHDLVSPVDGCQSMRVHDLLSIEAGSAVGNVINDRVVKKNHFLRYQRDLRAQAYEFPVSYVGAVDQYLAVCWIVESHQQVRQSRLAGAG